VEGRNAFDISRDGVDVGSRKVLETVLDRFAHASGGLRLSGQVPRGQIGHEFFLGPASNAADRSDVMFGAYQGPTCAPDKARLVSSCIRKIASAAFRASAATGQEQVGVIVGATVRIYHRRRRLGPHDAATHDVVAVEELGRQQEFGGAEFGRQLL
jgi:hypothetical protein